MASTPQEETSISHKGGNLRSYTNSFKSKVIQHAEKFSISSAARNYNLDRRMVSRWLKNRS